MQNVGNRASSRTYASVCSVPARSATIEDRGDRWLVIGAGPSGLSVSLALRRAGVAFDAVEADSGPGGLWNFDNPGSAIYETAHFISSSARSGWADLPMPDHYPDYPRWWEIRDYIWAYAAYHGLGRHYEFDTKVESAAPIDDAPDERWQVAFADGRRRRYRGVVACPGFQRVPRIPSFRGTFTGESRHSQTYKRVDELRGKRVLVVGAGNSGVDIAVDAANAADRALISVRRGYWFFPKLIGSVPLDHFGINTVSSQERLAEFLALYVGDVARTGFGEPDHPPLTHHPILNDQVLHHLSHGDLAWRPEVARLDGNRVHFVDGRCDDVDLILWATGYLEEMPFIDSEHCRISSVDADNDLFLWMFHRRYPHLCVLGPANLAAGGFWGLSAAADLIANHVRDELTRPDQWERFRTLIEGPEPDLTGGYSYFEREGHLNYVNASALDAYSFELAADFGFDALGYPADYVPPEVIDIDEWLDHPRPVERPPHGSLTPLAYDPLDLITNTRHQQRTSIRGGSARLESS